MKGLICSILEDKDVANCSNGGISSKCRTVILVGEGIDEVFYVTPESPAVRIEKRRLIGSKEPYLTAYPIEKSPEGRTSYMAGGAFIWSSDSRFPADYPVPLHDRTDTWDDYNALSI